MLTEKTNDYFGVTRVQHVRYNTYSTRLKVKSVFTLFIGRCVPTYQRIAL